MNLLQTVQAAVERALTGFVPDPAGAVSQVKPTQEARHGDYQANCALSLQKVVGGKPREIAQKIVERLELGDWLQPPEIAGPGFINLRLREDWLAAQMQRMAADPRLLISTPTQPQTYVIDYSSPNVAKPMHAGHLRSTIIGDALTRLLRFLGHKVVTDNHLGDWGTQFGMILYGWKNGLVDRKAYEADPVRELARLYIEVRKLTGTFDQLAAGFTRFLDQKAFATAPLAALARAYIQALQAAKEESEEDDEAPTPNPIAEAYREETGKLHAGNPENLALWKEFMPHAYDELRQVYTRLGILPFDHQHGESFYHNLQGEVVQDLLAKGLAVETNGAIGIFLHPEKEDEPPALIRYRNGAFTYTTSDLATIAYRVKEFQPDHILYVVDFRQGGHFANLFEIARRWGYDKVDLQHISFGSVLDPKTRKPIKTRDGGGVSLAELLDGAVTEARNIFLVSVIDRLRHGEDVPELTPEEEQRLTEVVGIGAVKYADLCQNRTSDYSFSWEKMLAMKGNTATYMQYAYARNRNIFRKGEEDVEAYRKEPPLVTVESPAERALALQLLRFEDALQAAREDLKPNLITGYLWDLSTAYSTFYQECPVLKAETPAQRKSRLVLCDLTARVIQQGLCLLGIQTVERM
jgi:arginyl-tRNA synthetase